MDIKSILKIDFATIQSAKYACENWHYSKCLPVGSIVKIGAWENNKFIGVVLFSKGASPNLLKPYGLEHTEGCELTRVALNKHINPVSRILSLAIKFLKKQCPGLRIIVSFADPRQGHIGGIYQATNWIYSGTQIPGGSLEYLINGKWTHPKSIGSKYGKQGKKFLEQNPNIQTRKPTLKYRYLFPLDNDMYIMLKKISKPYPKSMRNELENKVPLFHKGESGVTPTIALHLSDDAPMKPKGLL